MVKSFEVNSSAMRYAFPVIWIDISNFRFYHHRVAAVNLAGVQGIGDWDYDSDGESIDHDVLRNFH